MNPWLRGWMSKVSIAFAIAHDGICLSVSRSCGSIGLISANFESSLCCFHLYLAGCTFRHSRARGNPGDGVGCALDYIVYCPAFAVMILNDRSTLHYLEAAADPRPAADCRSYRAVLVLRKIYRAPDQPLADPAAPDDVVKLDVLPRPRRVRVLTAPDLYLQSVHPLPLFDENVRHVNPAAPSERGKKHVPWHKTAELVSVVLRRVQRQRVPVRVLRLEPEPALPPKSNAAPRSIAHNLTPALQRPDQTTPSF